MGRIIPSFFPKIFGPNKNEELGLDATKAAFHSIAVKINGDNNDKTKGKTTRMTVPEVALGFIKIANEAMCRPIRNLTMARGYDTKNHVLACFGGAGGQHCCGVARNLGIRTVFIHKFAGILSAYGMGLADVVQEEQEAASTAFTADNMVTLQQKLKTVAKCAANKLVNEGYDKSTITVTPYLNLRFMGTDTARFIPGNEWTFNDIISPPTDTMDTVDCEEKISEKGQESENVHIQNMKAIYSKYHNLFIERYRKEFGFVLERDISVDDIRCRAVSTGKSVSKHSIGTRPKNKPLAASCKLPFWTAWFDVPGEGIKRMETAVYDIADLYGGDIIKGPALVLQNTSTIVIEPKCSGEITMEGNMVITVGETEAQPVTTDLDNIQLAIFGHRFMSIAEQMGRALQRTSVSTNIKERLDFSCAIFGPTGLLEIETVPGMYSEHYLLGIL